MTATDTPLWVKGYLPVPITGPVDFPARFWDLVQRPYAANDHWLWKGKVHSRDGPRYNSQSPRRLVYEQLIGPIPEDQVTRITCGEPLCIFPAHIQLVPRTRTLK